MMELCDTQCCAVTEIADLSGHRNAEDAMIGFCEELMYHNEDVYDEATNEWKPNKTLSKPSGFYTFTGVVRDKHSARANVKYAPEFATYIKKHKLGQVTESVARPNRVNHPGHIIKVYVWAPNERNLRSWWRKHGQSG